LGLVPSGVGKALFGVAAAPRLVHRQALDANWQFKAAAERLSGTYRLTSHSSRTRFAGRLNSGVRPMSKAFRIAVSLITGSLTLVISVFAALKLCFLLGAFVMQCKPVQGDPCDGPAFVGLAIAVFVVPTISILCSLAAAVYIWSVLGPKPEASA